MLVHNCTTKCHVSSDFSSLLRQVQGISASLFLPCYLDLEDFQFCHFFFTVTLNTTIRNIAIRIQLWLIYTNKGISGTNSIRWTVSIQLNWTTFSILHFNDFFIGVSFPFNIYKVSPSIFCCCSWGPRTESFIKSRALFGSGRLGSSRAPCKCQLSVWWGPSCCLKCGVGHHMVKEQAC
jgi:hypothetical protein